MDNPIILGSFKLNSKTLNKYYFDIINEDNEQTEINFPDDERINLLIYNYDHDDEGDRDYGTFYLIEFIKDGIKKIEKDGVELYKIFGVVIADITYNGRESIDTFYSAIIDNMRDDIKPELMSFTININDEENSSKVLRKNDKRIKLLLAKNDNFYADFEAIILKYEYFKSLMAEINDIEGFPNLFIDDEEDSIQRTLKNAKKQKKIEKDVKVVPLPSPSPPKKDVNVVPLPPPPKKMYNPIILEALNSKTVEKYYFDINIDDEHPEIKLPNDESIHLVLYNYEGDEDYSKWVLIEFVTDGVKKIYKNGVELYKIFGIALIEIELRSQIGNDGVMKDFIGYNPLVMIDIHDDNKPGLVSFTINLNDEENLSNVLRKNDNVVKMLISKTDSFYEDLEVVILKYDYLKSLQYEINDIELEENFETLDATTFQSIYFNINSGTENPEIYLPGEKKIFLFVYHHVKRDKPELYYLIEFSMDSIDRIKKDNVELYEIHGVIIADIKYKESDFDVNDHEIDDISIYEPGPMSLSLNLKDKKNFSKVLREDDERIQLLIKEIDKGKTGIQLLKYDYLKSLFNGIEKVKHPFVKDEKASIKRTLGKKGKKSIKTKKHKKVTEMVVQEEVVPSPLPQHEEEVVSIPQPKPSSYFNPFGVGFNERSTNIIVSNSAIAEMEKDVKEDLKRIAIGIDETSTIESIEESYKNAFSKIFNVGGEEMKNIENFKKKWIEPIKDMLTMLGIKKSSDVFNMGYMGYIDSYNIFTLKNLVELHGPMWILMYDRILTRRLYIKTMNQMMVIFKDILKDLSPTFTRPLLIPSPSNKHRIFIDKFPKILQTIKNIAHEGGGSGNGDLIGDYKSIQFDNSYDFYEWLTDPMPDFKTLRNLNYRLNNDPLNPATELNIVVNLLLKEAIMLYDVVSSFMLIANNKKSDFGLSEIPEMLLSLSREKTDSVVLSKLHDIYIKLIYVCTNVYEMNLAPRKNK